MVFSQLKNISVVARRLHRRRGHTVLLSGSIGMDRAFEDKGASVPERSPSIHPSKAVTLWSRRIPLTVVTRVAEWEASHQAKFEFPRQQ